MRKFRPPLAVFVLALLPFAAWTLPKVAVLDLTLQKGIDATVIAPVTESVMEEVVDARAYVVLDRAYIEQILKEKEFQLSGMVSDTQVAQAGQYLGADYVVAGKIQMVGDTYFVVAKMIEVKTGVIVAQSSDQGEGKLAVLLTMAHAVGKKLVAGAPISALSPSAAPAAPAAPVAPVAKVEATEQKAPAPGPAIDQGPVEDRLPSKPVKLSVLALRDSKGPDAPVWKAVMDAFRDKYPNISIVEESVKDSPLYFQKLEGYAKAKKLPDVFVMNSGSAPYPAKDLRRYLRSGQGEFVAPTLRPAGPDGAIQYLPETLTATNVLYANGQALDRLGLSFPKTLDELIEQVPAIRAAGLIPIAMSDKDGWPMQSCLLSTLVERTGGPGWLGRALRGEGTSFDSPAFIGALEAIQRMSQAKLFSSDIAAIDYGATPGLLAQKAVYSIDGSWRTIELAQNLGPEGGDSIVIGAFPDLLGQAGPSGSTSAISQGYAMNAALSGDKEAAAWLWLWFCDGPEGQRIRFERVSTQGGIDPRKWNPDVEAYWAKLYDFFGSAPESDIIDQRLNPTTNQALNSALQGLIAGRKKPEAIAKDIEASAARNQPDRKRKP